MIYLTTGANGAGKTLLTLRDVQEKSIKESRPVYHNGRFEIVPTGPLSTWTKIETKDWQDCPDGSIIVVDECHNLGDFPPRTGKEPVPPHVLAMAEHRRRGFDFYLITQHPMSFDPFVRRLIGSPGWHRHLKRASGAPLVSVLTWPAVNDQPQKNGSGESASVAMTSFPKEVYSWYVSTQLDTSKLKIPFQVKVLAACLLIVPVVGYLGWSKFVQTVQPKTPVTTLAAGSSIAPGQPSAAPSQVLAAAVLSPAQYMESFTPRVEGLAYTAPRYDEKTKPVTVPYPAACISSGPRCQCYSQQATRLDVPASLCNQIVKGGYFNDWIGALADASSGKAVKADSAPITSI